VAEGPVREAAPEAVRGTHPNLLEQVRADVQHPEQDGVTIVTCDEHDRTTIVIT
jgi:hypothetical protein